MMKTYQKLTAILLVLVMLLSFAACSGGSAAHTEPGTGKYIAVSAKGMGSSLTADEMWEGGFTIDLKDGGKCSLAVGNKKANGKWTLTGSAVNIKGGMLECEGYFDNDRLILTNVFGVDIDTAFLSEIVFLKEGAPIITEVYHLPGTASSFDYAITNATHIQEAGAFDFYGDWYGWMSLTNCWGYSDNSDELYDVTAICDTDNTGKTYLEVFMEDRDGAVLSMYIDMYDDYISADIGDEDAWFLNRYLVPSESYSFSSGVDNGKLEFVYDYVDPDDNASGFTVTFCLRKYGELWDASVDTLPPGYSDYLSEIG